MERQGGSVTPETLTHDVTTDPQAEVEELLVEEVSIDGLCGVY
jgi:mycofactocin precursor